MEKFTEIKITDDPAPVPPPPPPPKRCLNEDDLRDWFAGQALMGWAAGRNKGDDIYDTSPSIVADACYNYADAMMAKRSES